MAESGPKKLSIALFAEGCHREACLQQSISITSEGVYHKRNSQTVTVREKTCELEEIATPHYLLPSDPVKQLTSLLFFLLS